MTDTGSLDPGGTPTVTPGGPALSPRQILLAGLAGLAAILFLVHWLQPFAPRVHNDPKALGFASRTEMEAAFAKGYHTRAKMEEMARFYAGAEGGGGTAAAASASASGTGGPTTQAAAASSGGSFAPSFNCAKATDQVNTLICANRDLSELDVKLDAAFKAAMAKSGEGDRIRSEQRAWLKKTNNGCSDHDCIAQAYTTRIQQLQGELSK